MDRDTPVALRSARATAPVSRRPATMAIVSEGPVHDPVTVARRLSRDQWVRLHGTPRVTVLVGGARARRLWTEWAALAQVDATLREAGSDLDGAIRAALAEATRDPLRPLALLTTPPQLARWSTVGSDRLRALVAEGVLEIPEPDAPDPHDAPVRPTRAGEARAGESPRPPDAHSLDARSAAEASLFEALEATPATAGLFELNARLAIRFGPDAAEVDLLSRRHAIAIEIDGYHHFTDQDGYRRDRRKDLLLQTQGLLVLRFLAHDVMRDPREAVTTVCQAIAYRDGGAR